MTLSFVCGAECGILGGTGTDPTHFDFVGTTPSVSTSIFRSGLRSWQVNPVAAETRMFTEGSGVAQSVWVVRCYVYFASLPDADVMLLGVGSTTVGGIAFKVSDSKLYAAGLAAGVFTFGASGVSVTTGQWYRLDMRWSSPTVVAQVDGVVLGNGSGNSATATTFSMGSWGATNSADIYFDDISASVTSADYPIGSGYVAHFVPTADGSHNIAGIADFRRGAAGADITNSNTNSYDLVDEVPCDDGTPTADDFITCLNPPNATDYTENIFGPAPGVSAPTQAPNAFSVLVCFHQAGTGIGSFQFKLNDNGTEDIIKSTSNAGTTTIRSSYKVYPEMVGGGAWTLARFNDLRIRFGYSSDANPDQYFDCAMIEAEFAPAVEKLAPPPQIISQSLKRASFF